MLNIILYEPQIPPNTGNVIRLCANSGASLHLIRPLGFTIDNKSFRRAGLDYHHMTTLKVHDSLDACLECMRNATVFAITKFGSRPYSSAKFKVNDVLLFGSETRGLPSELREGFHPSKSLYIPMRKGNRSINLSNAVAITLYEAWRQIGFL